MAEQSKNLVWAEALSPLEAGYPSTVNRGDHVIYTGGKYVSSLVAPVIPPR